jgi:hypothetical protein
MTFQDLHPKRNYYLRSNQTIGLYHIHTITEKIIGIQPVHNPQAGITSPSPIYYLIEDFILKYAIIEEA